MTNKTDKIDGILLVNKPENIGSFKITKSVEKLLRAKTGHAGTLDPFATGLMLIGINKATRLLEYLSNCDKEYIATAKWNQETDTLDPEGSVIKTSDKPIDHSKLKKVLEDFTGVIRQTPPIYSALKHHGTPLYKLARQGVEITPKSREVNIYNIENLSNNLDDNTSIFKIHCSKGTYIRSLIRDIAHALDNHAYVSALSRTKIDDFTLGNALDFSDLQQMSTEDIIKSKAYTPIDEIRINDNIITLNAAEYLAFMHGKKITRNDLHFRETDVINTVFQGKLIGISKITGDEEKYISPVKVFI